MDIFVGASGLCALALLSYYVVILFRGDHM